MKSILLKDSTSGRLCEKEINGNTIADINGVSHYIIKSTKLWNTEITITNISV